MRADFPVSRLTRDVTNIFASVGWVVAMTVAISANYALGQEPLLDVAPPPLAIISKDERSKLDRAPDPKDRIKVAADLMDLRLDLAEKLSTNEEFDAMFRELGGFQALVSNSLEFLDRRNNGNSKVLDAYKKLEIELRQFMPRLESIRRDLPLRYEEYVRKLLRYVREARAAAVDPMFSDTVVPVPRPD